MVYFRGGVNQLDVHALALDAQGNVYVTGGFWEDLYMGGQWLTHSRASADMFVVKYTPQGVATWAAQSQSSTPGNDAYGYSVGVDAQGGVSVGGIFLGAARFGPLALNSPGSTSMFVVKYSPTGVPAWARQGGQSMPASSLSTARAVAGGPAGEVYLMGQLAGSTGGFGTSPTLRPADGNVVLVKYDAQGNVQWVKQGGGGNNSWAGGLAVDAAGHLYLAAHLDDARQFNGQTIPFPYTPGSRVTGLFKFDTDAAGSLLWVQTLGEGIGVGTDVKLDATGNPYVLGGLDYRLTLGGTTLTTAGRLDALVVAYTPQGTVRWAQSGGGPNDEWPSSLAVDGTGRATVIGTFTQASRFGATSLTSLGSQYINNGFVAHLAAAGPTATTTARLPRPLTLYPNPARGAASVALPLLPAGSRVRVLDATGRCIHTTATTTAPPALATAGWPMGLYVVQASTPDGLQWSGKLLVE